MLESLKRTGPFFVLLALCWAMAWAPLQAGAHVWSADEVPMVHLQDCNRYVCDPEQRLTQEERDSSDADLARLHRECGVQTVFVVVGNVKDGDCFRMAQDVGNRHGVGTRKERKGLVIVLAVDDRRYFIAPGKGLEADLTDIECDDIGRACIVSNMRVNRVGDAVLETSKAIYQKLKTGKTGIPQFDNGGESTESDVWLGIFLFAIFFGMPVWLFVRNILESLGLMTPRKVTKRGKNRKDDDWFPPCICGGGTASGGGVSGGSFGGGSFGGGGAGGGW